jgi:hypothetical protein
VRRGRVHEHRACAEVDLRGFGRSERQSHGDVGRSHRAQPPQHAHDRRVAARVGVLALQRRVDRAALHAGVEPVLHDLAQRLDA